MNRVVKIVCALAVLNVSAVAIAQDDWQQCPTSTGGRVLDKWRGKLAQQVVAGNSQGALDRINACFTKAPRCFDDLKYYADKNLNPAAYSGADGRFDQQDLTIDSVQDFPAPFRGSDNTIRIPDNIMELAQNDPNINAVKYRTRSSGGFDSGSGLFIATISTPQYDIVLQTSPSTRGHGTNDPDPNPNFNGNFADGQNVLTVITVDKTKNPAVGQIRLMRKVSDREGYQWSNETRVGECTGCHTMPMRPISPVGYKQVNHENRMSAEQEAQVDAVNAILKQPMSWGGKKVGDKHVRFGQPIDSQPTGWAPKDSPTRKEEFLRSCATSQPSFSYRGIAVGPVGYEVNLQQDNPPQIDYAKLAQAMNCVDCHNDQNRGSLHSSYSQDEIRFKIAVDRSMPEGIDLTKDERLALLACLNAERGQESVRLGWRASGDWMTRQSCFGDQGAQLAPATPVPAETGTGAGTGQ